MISDNGLHDLARELDDNLERMVTAARDATARPLARPIPGNLGTVVSSGAGRLVSVHLDARVVAYTSDQFLGTALTSAIQDAERRATEAWRQHVADARRVTVHE